ncbi:MAG: hypothetical protein EPN49_15025 [Rhodanobacter sp.]|nr:MAG: hypothetical protein EPN49_15025 [Rhodanobacter sp.]
MNMKRLFSIVAGSLLVGSVWAQTNGKPLNLKLPPGDVPAANSTAPAPAAAANPIMTGSVPAIGATAAPTSKTPGVYYGDTSGRIGNDTAAAAPACDDATYNKAQVHGSVGMGVAAGNHFSGNYQTGTINVTKRLGSCDDPQGGMSMSISVGTSHLNGGRRHYGRSGF